MKISDRLQRFIEQESGKLPRSIAQLRESRRKYRQAKASERKRIERKRDKRLRLVEQARELNLEVTTTAEQIEAEAQAETKRFESEHGTEELFKGKPHLDVDNFCCLSWYLIKQETTEKDGVIYRWIAGFLTAKGFTKKTGKEYTVNDIKRYVYRHETCPEREHKESFFDHLFDHPIK